MAVLVYGAYGYTGRLIVEEAIDRGIDVVAAGRNRAKISDLATRVGCDGRCVSLSGDLTAALQDVPVVLNCAGPFVDTYEPLVEACIETGTHYLDITGEIDVFEAIAERDRAAERAEICLLPGVGFDVVPTDCLAAHLKQRLPDATTLRLGIDHPGTVSGGTAATAIGQLGDGGRVRKHGELVTVPAAWQTRIIDFGTGPRTATTVPLGDVSTAYYTTGIGDIEQYLPVSSRELHALKLLAYAGPLVRLSPVKHTAQRIARRLASGPDERTRAEKRAYIWGEVSSGEQTAVSRLVTPETYALTIDAATTAVERILEDPPIGFETPAVAFGPDFVCSLDGVERSDEPIDG
jgi:short subunit dehydrogenase-like uncharacterized protein